MNKENLNFLRNKKVLMIDDDESIINRLKSFMEKITNENFFFKVYSENNRVNILKYIKNIDPDVIILDYNLSYKTKGIDIMAELPKNLKNKVIGFSTINELKMNFLEAGASGFVWKGAGETQELVKLLEKESEKINPNP